jgi:hypothetical protein
MKKRSHNYRRIKIHRSYTVEGIASLFDIHKNTVRTWIKEGLQTTDNKRPMLIQGRDLAAFLQVRRLKNKKKCNPGEIYCVRCHAPNAPAGDMADYQPINDKIGNLIAICSCCYSIMNRRVSLANLEHILGKIIVTLPPALQHIRDRNKPTVNSNLEKDIKLC